MKKQRFMKKAKINENVTKEVKLPKETSGQP
jgi:hypothetical protein